MAEKPKKVTFFISNEEIDRHHQKKRDIRINIGDEIREKKKMNPYHHMKASPRKYWRGMKKKEDHGKVTKIVSFAMYPETRKKIHQMISTKEINGMSITDLHRSVKDIDEIRYATIRNWIMGFAKIGLVRLEKDGRRIRIFVT